LLFASTRPVAGAVRSAVKTHGGGGGGCAKARNNVILLH
jgi:hypothetical protein